MMTENEQYLAEQRTYLLQTKMKMYRAAEKVDAATEVYKCRRIQLHEAFDIIMEFEEFKGSKEAFNRLKEKSVQISVKVLRNIGKIFKEEGFSL